MAELKAEGDGVGGEKRLSRWSGRAASARVPFAAGGSAVLLLWLLCCCLFAALGRCQMAPPFDGQGGFAAEPVTIYVSPLMERLLSVDDINYRFENIVYLWLSWEDSGAKDAMMASTEGFRNGSLEECARPCTSEGKLSRNSETFQTAVSCCDGVWLPTLGMLNVYELPEGRMQPYEINVDVNSDSVAWWTAIHAVYFTPMDFRRFPFDSQKLVMQFGFKGTNEIKEFIPSAQSTRFLVRGEGDIVSGWDVKSLEVQPRNFTLESELSFFLDNYGKMPAPTDPTPVLPSSGAYEGVNLVSFDLVITIERLYNYYVLNMIVPILLLVSLSVVTYIIPAESLDIRIALNLTLFLSLTALQFIVNDQLPRSSYPSAVTKLILICYCAVAYGVPETIVVYAITRSSKVKEEMASPRPSSLKAIDENEPEDDEAMHGNMSIAMKVLKKPGKAAFILDMVSLVVVLIVVVLATILVVLGF